jgi:hypothetical protein
MAYLLCLLAGGLIGFLACLRKSRTECRYCALQEKFLGLP